MGTGIIIYLLVSLSACDAFRAGAARLTASPRLATAQRSARSGLVVANSPREADDSSDDSSAYSVDWDSALQKELRARSEGNAAWRPEGREPVPEEKLREVRVQRVVDETQSKIADTFDPSDWKVWIGLLLVISVATAVLGHAPAGSDGTYSV